MTTMLPHLPHPTSARANGLDRRTLLRGAAVLATTAVTVKAASAATVTPFGQTGAPTTATQPLPLGPLPGSRYPDAHLESLKKPKVSFGPTGFPAFTGTAAVEAAASMLGIRKGQRSCHDFLPWFFVGRERSARIPA